jgi:hypothetical protein
MIRKLLMVAAVAIVPVGAIAFTGVSAGAVTAPTATAKCGAVSGTLAFSIPISNTGHTLAPGASSTQVITVTATLTKCTNTATSPPYTYAITKGAVSGKISDKTTNTTTSPETIDTCAGLAGTNTVSGSLKTTWTANHALPATTSKFTQETGGTVGSGSSAHGTFILGPTGDLAGTGSFLGTNHGETDTSNAKTVDTLGTLLTACASPVSSLKIETWKVPAATFS